ncbi:MAG TPA: hypothetical protein VJS64_19465, partial [Pyrinomonadaceae bacterium]|nr:hypothetical protein [Pyrinomonadaceae bacterium]
ANENAAQYHEVLNGPEIPFEYANQLMPALIPMGAEDQFRQLFEEYSPGYKKALGSGPIGQRSGGLVENVDMILTSVSTQNALGELLEKEVYEWAQIGSLEAVIERVDGDIAGVLLRKMFGSDPLLDEFDQHWTGITRNDIERCARRAKDKKHASPGVCVVAIGSNKAAVILKCLLAPHGHEAGETGLISRLICDHDLAMELMRLAKEEKIAFEQAQSNQPGR